LRAVVALGFPCAVNAQQFLLTVETQGEHFLALIDAGGALLARTTSYASSPLTGAVVS